MKKILDTWMLGLTLSLLAVTPACIVVDDGGDDDGAGDETGSNDDADDGNADDGNADDGNADDGNADDGNADDGNADDGNADDGGPSSDVGQQCTANDECDVICLFSGDSDFGFCSIPCDDVFDCPDFWECVEVNNATLTYCAPD
ncbi:MAG: hypothetical protein AB1Z98_05395 [Nannocystaceae bacterium]